MSQSQPYAGYNIYEFSAPLRQGKQGKATYYLVHLSEELSGEIRFITGSGKEKRGWDSVKIQAQIGKQKWASSLFYMRKSKAYMLLIKGAIRKKENLEIGDDVTITIWVDHL